MSRVKAVYEAGRISIIARVPMSDSDGVFDHEALSLTWEEAGSLRDDLVKLVPQAIQSDIRVVETEIAAARDAAERASEHLTALHVRLAALKARAGVP